MNILLSKIEAYFYQRPDKMLHFLIMSVLLVPVSLVWHSWLITILAAILGASTKEYVDVQYRGKKCDWQDWMYGVGAGVIQAIILI